MFFTYSQNNSGGSFIIDDVFTTYMIIEADNAKEANSIAEGIGLYFDGYGDCPCCGNRWSEQWCNEDGDDEPSVYGQPISEGKTMRDYWVKPDQDYARIFYKNGVVIGVK